MHSGRFTQKISSENFKQISRNFVTHETCFDQISVVGFSKYSMGSLLNKSLPKILNGKTLQQIGS